MGHGVVSLEALEQLRLRLSVIEHPSRMLADEAHFWSIHIWV
jgi:hypothetical protein